MRFVGLTPQHRGTEPGQRERPQQFAGQSEPQRLHGQDAADSERSDRQVLTAPIESPLRAAAPARLRRHEHPERGIHRQPGPGRERQCHESEADDEHVDPKVGGEPASDTGDELALGSAREFHRRRLGGGGQRSWWTPHDRHTSGASLAAARSQTQGRARVVPDGRRDARGPRSWL